ncbi:uncharacterized protein LOC127725998 [Mytilus californianus]|uniref:uncharacterized protein LOC127725998 n=1 Tax=Mytilus californianus TaxID=6549 RepID=UPI0022457426|nr:uncharacterized protein LOC127725998 [Mytilus californianus]
MHKLGVIVFTCLLLVIVPFITGDDGKNTDTPEKETRHGDSELETNEDVDGKEVEKVNKNKDVSNAETDSKFDESSSENSDSKSDETERSDKIDTHPITNTDETSNIKGTDFLSVPKSLFVTAPLNSNIFRKNVEDDSYEDTDVTEAEIRGIINNVDLLLERDNLKGASKKREESIKHKITTDVDGSSHSKVSSLSKDDKLTSSRKNTINGITNEMDEFSDTELLSLLENLSKYDDSEIQMIDGKELMNVKDTKKQHASTERNDESETDLKGLEEKVKGGQTFIEKEAKIKFTNRNNENKDNRNYFKVFNHMNMNDNISETTKYEGNKPFKLTQKKNDDKKKESHLVGSNNQMISSSVLDLKAVGNKYRYNVKTGQDKAVKTLRAGVYLDSRKEIENEDSSRFLKSKDTIQSRFTGKESVSNQDESEESKSQENINIEASSTHSTTEDVRQDIPDVYGSSKHGTDEDSSKYNIDKKAFLNRKTEADSSQMIINVEDSPMHGKEKEVIQEDNTDVNDPKKQKKNDGGFRQMNIDINSPSKQGKIEGISQGNNYSKNPPKDETEERRSMKNIDVKQSAKDETEESRSDENIDVKQSAKDKTEENRSEQNLDVKQSAKDETAESRRDENIDVKQSAKDKTEESRSEENIDVKQSAEDETEESRSDENIDVKQSAKDKTEESRSEENIDVKQSAKDETEESRSSENIDVKQSAKDGTREHLIRLNTEVNTPSKTATDEDNEQDDFNINPSEYGTKVIMDEEISKSKISVEHLNDKKATNENMEIRDPSEHPEDNQQSKTITEVLKGKQNSMKNSEIKDTSEQTTDKNVDKTSINVNYPSDKSEEDTKVDSIYVKDLFKHPTEKNVSQENINANDPVEHTSVIHISPINDVKNGFENREEDDYSQKTSEEEEDSLYISTDDLSKENVKTGDLFKDTKEEQVVEKEQPVKPIIKLPTVPLFENDDLRIQKKNKMTAGSLYLDDDDESERTNNNLKLKNEDRNSLNNPPVIGRNNLNTASNVIDMSVENSVKTRRLLAQLDDKSDSTDDGSEASEMAETFLDGLISNLPNSTEIPVDENIFETSTPSGTPEDTTVIADFTPADLACLSNPCVNGTCKDISSGRYICLCDVGFTGNNCEDAIDPCIVNPCPLGATCLPDGASRICVCQDGLKGPNCEQDDVLVVCNDLTIEHNLKVDNVIKCTKTVNSTPDDLCYDPDDTIKYEVIITDGAFSGYIDNNLTVACLKVNPKIVSLPEYCINVTASEQDDRIHRPWRKATSTVCITFNKPPEFSPISPVTVNIRDVQIGDPLMVVDTVDNLSLDNPLYSIEDVYPDVYKSNFRISRTGEISFVSIPDTIPNDSLNLLIRVKVNDNGIPPLEAEATVNITLVDIDLQCNFPKEIYLGISSNTTILGVIRCTGATRLTYQFIPSPGLPLIFGAQGTIVVTRGSKIDLQAGDYNVSVQIRASTVASFTLDFIVHVDYYEPSCFNLSPEVMIHKSTPPGNCFPVSFCNETQNGNIRCGKSLSGQLAPYLSPSCTMAASEITMKICVDTYLQNVNVKYDVTGTVENDFGVTDIVTTVNIFNNPPVILNVPLTANVSEDAQTGRGVLTIEVEDDFPPPIIQLLGPSIPFRLNGTDIFVSGKLDFEISNSYDLTILVTDSEGLSVTAFPTVKIIDVNEKPVCHYVNGTYIINIDASETPGTTIGKLNCTDQDIGDQTKYEIDGTQAVLDTFEIDEVSGDLRLRKQPEAGKNLFEFNVKVTDRSGLKTSVNVKVYFSFYPPKCGNVQIQVQKNEDSFNCDTINTTCVDPQGGFVNYTKGSSADAVLFNVSGTNDGRLVLCPVTSLVGEVRTLQFEVFAKNEVGQTPIQISIEVRDVNSNPYFVRLRNFTVSEKAFQGTLIGVVTAEDQDTVNQFKTLRYFIDDTQFIFNMDQEKGEIRLGQIPLNASNVPQFSLRLRVTDAGGLSDSTTVYITVIDENDPPVCLNPSNIIPANVNLTTPVGAIVTSLICWDYDMKVKYRTIIYNITGDNEGIFSVNGNGQIIVTKPIPRNSRSFRFQVYVSDLVMIETGNLTQRTILDVSVAVNTNYPPQCEKTISNLQIEETKIVGDCIEEIICNDVTLGDISIGTVTGTGSSYFEVKSRASNTQGQLPLNLCVINSIKDRMGSYRVTVTVTNGLGTTSVTWNLEIIDVNEPPYFVNTPYRALIPETVGIGYEVLGVTWGDPDIRQEYKTVTVTSQAQSPSDAAQNINFIANFNKYYISKVQNATVQNLYWFQVTATDSAGLSSIANVTIEIQDVNERPICPLSNRIINIGLLTNVGEVLDSLNCYDTDKDDNNRNLTYIITPQSDNFDVSKAGDITLTSPLLRWKDRYDLYIIVSDVGTPPLTRNINVAVNINRQIEAECSPLVDYPSIWVKDACVKLNMSCTDPTLPDTTHLQYLTSGNFTPQAFVLTKVSQGVFELCYKLLGDSNTQLIVTVRNGLQDYVYNLDLQVKYAASTPEFTQSKYVKEIPEDAVVGTSVLQVNATANGGGNIRYSIQGTAYPGVLEIIPDTGIVKTNASLTIYANKVITIQVQAYDLLSQLKSSVDVDITVEDVNEPPECTLGLPVIPAIRVDTSINTIIQNITCSDPDVKAENRDLDYSISGLDVLTYFKTQRISPYMVELATKSLLSVTKAKFDVVVTVKDGGQPQQTITLPFELHVDLTPPVPTLEVSAVNMTAIKVKWLYQRQDFYTVTNKFTLKINNIELDLPVDKDQSQSYVVNLDPDTVYNVKLEADTNYGTVITPLVSVKTPAVPVLSTFVASIKITDDNFDSQLLDTQSYRYVTLSTRVTTEMAFVLNRTPGFVSVSVMMFRRGSVIVDSLVTVNQTGTVAGTSNSIRQAVSTGFVGQMSVDPNYVIIGNGDGYIRVTGISVVGNYYQDTSVTFTCSADIIGKVGTVGVTWKLKNAVINPTTASRWKTETLPDDTQYPGRRQYQLKVNPMQTGDTGNISCHISDGKLQSDWTIDVAVIGKPIVSISPMTTTVHQGDSFNIVCQVVETYGTPSSITWHKNGESFNGGPDEIIDRANFTYHVLKISNIQNSISYSCLGVNVAGTGKQATTTITVIQSGISYKYCPTSIDSYGKRWNGTIGDTEVIVPCTGDYTGTVSRFCMKDGIWEDPDYSRCVRIDLQEVNEQSDNLKNGVEVAEVDNILQTMTALTSDNYGELTSGDLEVSSSTLDNVADHASERTNSLVVDQLDEFVSCCDNLLNEKYKPRWEQLRQQNLVGISRVVKAVTTYSKAYTHVDNSVFTKFVQKDNLIVQVGKVQNKDVIFPDKSQSLPSWVTESTTSIKLNKATLGGQQPIGYSSTYYRNISNLFHQYLLVDGGVRLVNSSYDVNSVVIDFSIEPAPSKLNSPLIAEFEYLSVNYSSPICAFWDFSVLNTPNGAWSTTGARLVKSTDEAATCEYDHTTNFAVLMSPGKTPPADILALSIISAVGCAISLLFLLVTVIIYIVFWRYLKSDRSTILVNLCVALILSYTLFLVGVTQTENKDLCTGMAVLLHYIFLVDFLLMLAEGIEVAFCVLYVFSTRSRVHWLIPVCWIIPVIIVAISMGATKLEGYGNSKFCWLTLESGLLWAFVGPALLVVLINLIILILVLKTMFSSHSMLTKTAKQQAKAGMRSICVILPLFGVTWVLGVFSVNEDLVVFQYLFAIFNSLQGVFIFLFHCFFNRQVRESIQHSRRRKRSTHIDLSKSTSQSSKTKNLTRESSENIHNNFEEDLKNSKNPFLQADNQVQQIVDKFKKTDHDGKEYNLHKEAGINIDDIKITNIMREAEINDSRDLGSSARHSASGSEKRKSDRSSTEKSSYGSREGVKYKASSSSSRTVTTATTRSTDLDTRHSSRSSDLRHSSRSEEDYESKMRENQTRLESIYSGTYERKLKSEKSRSNQYSPKQRKKTFEPGPSHKKGGSHWGKTKQKVPSKKPRSHDDERIHEKSHHKRSRHRDRSEMYEVDYYDNPAHQSHHRSMDDVNMQYMGYPQPFVRTYDPLRTPHGYHHPDVPWYEVRRNDYC